MSAARNTGAYFHKKGKQSSLSGMSITCDEIIEDESGK